MTHILTSFLNMGAVPVMVNLFEAVLKERFKDWKKFFSQAFTRGYILSALWSPGGINVYLIVQATGLSWLEVVVPGMLMAVLGMVLSTLVEAVGTRDDEFHATVAGPKGGRKRMTASTGERSEDGKRIYHVLLVVLAFIATVVIMDRSSHGTATGRSAVAGIFIALCWTFALRRRPGIASSFRDYWIDGTSKVADIAPFFVAMGIFSTAIERSGFLAFADSLLQATVVQLGGAS
jgi:hypothetical protein